jgi:hypothetical protein
MSLLYVEYRVYIYLNHERRDKVDFLTESIPTCIVYHYSIVTQLAPTDHFPFSPITHISTTTMGGMHIIWVGVVVAAIAIVAWLVVPRGKNQVYV